jgi:signal transduction histidine kinase
MTQDRHEPPPSPAGADWLVGDSAIVELIRSKDWSQTPLGRIESWSESLQTTVSLCLACSFPINVVWGSQCIQIWNEGYAGVCGEKHPGEFASDYRECWASAWPAIGEAFETARAGQTAYLENQPMFLDRNGYLEETWFTFSLSPIRDEAGEIVGLFHPVTETTAGKLSERRTRALRDLASSAARARSGDEATALAFEVLSESALDLPFVLLYVVDEDGRRARIACHAGLDPGHAASPPLVDLSDTGADSPVARVMRTGQASHMTDLRARFGAIHAGPHVEPIEEALVMPIALPGAERPAGVLVAGVSTRLPLDETYRGFFDLVAAGVTSALANALAYEQERERAEALAEIDRAKTAFFSNVSHELRTPLTLILGPLEDELADADRLEPVRRERVEAAHRNALRLLRLVNSLLDFARIESGRVRATYEPTDLAAFTADLASLFRSATARAGLDLVVDCEPLPEPLFVDREMWEKIVLNLLSNAFKHTFEGAIFVALGWSGDGAELAVRDTGVGIPAEELPRLFERFHQVKGARARTFEGTGIGLALVRDLARLHGGEVRIESEEGRGSTFTVSVRAGRAHLPPEQVREPEGAAVATGVAAAHVDEALNWLAADGLPASPVGDDPPPAPVAEAGAERARLLLADDNADMRRHLRGLLEPRFDVTAVADGAAALEAALAAPPDVVLTDVMMPALDGFGLLARLRDDDRTRTIPVIMLSARAGEEAAVEGIGAGADDYLVKPFTARELLARVCGCLALARLRQETAKEREAAARAKGQFLANMSHEIRTPLNAILGMTSLMLRSQPAGEEDEQARIIQSSAEHLLKLIGNVLEFSKIEAGALAIDEAPFSVRRCVEVAIDIVTPAAAQKGVELSSRIEPAVPARVAGDEGRLRQILINLLDNAIKFSDAGEVALAVCAARGEDERDALRFRVRDSGPGIAEEDQAGLFEAFVQVDGTSTRAHEGAGLGLAISARLAELMGGGIAVDSRPGAGSTFEVVIPATSAGGSDPPEAALAEPPVPRRDGGDTTALSILVVDDNDMNRRVATRLLEKLGHAADVAASGSEAIEAIGRRRYDLVFIDVHMPGISGLEATRTIRERWPPRELRIVGLSGDTSDETRRESVAAGMDEFLTKPILLEHYAEALARAREARRA